jgi:hypothetical protein
MGKNGSDLKSLQRNSYVTSATQPPSSTMAAKDISHLASRIEREFARYTFWQSKLDMEKR